MSIDDIKREPEVLQAFTSELLVQYRRCYAPFQSTEWLLALIDEELSRRNEWGCP